jgi:hypothetical protein
MAIKKSGLQNLALAIGMALWWLTVSFNSAGQQAQPAATPPAPAAAAAEPLADAVTPAVKTEVKPAPATPIAVKKVELGKPSWDSEWDKIIEDAVPEKFLTSKKVARDVRPFCPRYKSMSDVDKKQYWAYFFQALAGAEAGLEPTTNVRHNDPAIAVKDTVTKRIVRQEGLLQLTYMDANRYGCDFEWEADRQLAEKDPAKTILQPKNNLLCGIRILSNQLIVRRWPLLTHKSYWITLQPGTISYEVFRKQMVNVPEVCRQPAPVEEARAKGAGAGSQEQPGDEPANDIQ